MGRTKLGLIVPFLFLVACGGDGGNSGPVDQDTAADYCQQGCDREHECDATSDVTMCVSNCVDEVTGVIREDVFVAVTECEVALSCDATDNTCFVDNCDPTGAHNTYEQHCRDRLAECDFPADTINGVCETTPAAGTDGEDVGYICAIQTSIINELDACFDEADCAAVMSCFQEVASQYGL